MLRGVVVALLFSAPTLAAERTLTLTDFDRVIVEGPFVVDIATGRPSGGRVSGDARSLDQASVAVQGRTLRVRKSVSSWGGYPGKNFGSARVFLTVPTLRAVEVSGSSTVAIDKLRNARLVLSLQGSGSLSVGQIDADRVDIALTGSGRIALAGSVAQLGVIARGSGDLNGSDLLAADATVASETAGTVTVGVRRSAKVTASGSGNVTILGTPACTVQSVGSGSVNCGK